MLDLIRKYRTEFSVIFVVSSAGMVLTMFGSSASRMGGGGRGLSNGVIAKVEGEEIKTSEVIEAWNRQMQEGKKAMMARGGNNPEMQKFMDQYLRSQITPDRALRSLIQNKFYVSTAEHSGVTAPPDAIRDMIAHMDSFHDKNGQFDPLLYRQSVTQPALFEKDLAMQAEFESFRSAFVSGLSVVSSAELADDARLNQPRVLEELTVKPKEFPDPAKADPKEVAAFVANPLSKAKIQAYYDQHIADYQHEEQIRARHILVREAEGGQKKIDEIAASLKSGKVKFEDAAKKYSSDKSNAGKGGDLGFFGKGAMDPAFEKAAFELKKPGDISAPVKSAFGYHLIQLVDRKAAEKKALNEVQNSIASQVWLESKRHDNALSWLNSWLSTGHPPADKDLKKYGLEWKKLPDWTPMSEKLGNLGSMEAQLPELMRLNAAKPLLSQPIPQGENLIALRWVSTKPLDAPKDFGLTIGYEKAQDAFQFYLRRRFEALEKNKKIVTSDKILSQLRQQAGAAEEGG